VRTSRTRTLLVAAVVGALPLIGRSSPAYPDESRYESLANAPFPGGYPSKEASVLLENELLFQQGIQTYLWSLPAISMWAMKEGSEKVFGAGYNVLPYWPKRLTAKTLVTTPNSDVIYAMSYLALELDGPLVVEAPHGVQGLFDDFWQRPLVGPTIDGHTWIGDVGLAGPDKGKGGIYVLLPPDYTGDVPQDGFVYRSRSYNVFLFWRTFFSDPDDLSKADEIVRQTRVYPLGKKDQAKPMQFPDANSLPADMLFPQDGSYFDMLSRFIDAEYDDPADFYMRGVLEMIGIEKGKPFHPDGAARTLLDQSAKAAFKMSRVVANDMVMQAPGGRFYPDRQWVNVFPGQDPFFHGNNLYRTMYFTVAYGMSPGMAVSMVDRGAKYPGAFRDKDGDFLDGGKSYTLHLPPNVPAANFWSVTLYDALTASGLDNGQPFPSLNSMDKLTSNADGSFDLRFGPDAPADAGKNWMRTVPGKGYFVLLRLYSPQQTFFDQTWKPGDVEKVN
jgi:hypothetical protein